jgi:hypothetical protein
MLAFSTQAQAVSYQHIVNSETLSGQAYHHSNCAAEVLDPAFEWLGQGLSSAQIDQLMVRVSNQAAAAARSELIQTTIEPFWPYRRTSVA